MLILCPGFSTGNFGAAAECCGEQGRGTAPGEGHGPGVLREGQGSQLWKRREVKTKGKQRGKGWKGVIGKVCEWRLSSSPPARRGSSTALFPCWEDDSFKVPSFSQNTCQCFSLLLPSSQWDNSSPYIVSCYKNARKAFSCQVFISLFELLTNPYPAQPLTCQSSF